MTPTLRGTEVTLRPLGEADVDALVAAASESRGTYGLSFIPDGVEQMRARVQGFLRDERGGTRIPFVTEWRGRVVGMTSFIEPKIWEWPPGSKRTRRDTPDTVEIGATWLAASAQRTRCNTEAKLLMLTHAFETWRVHSVTLKTDERNARSRRAIERLGARLDGVRRADMPGADDTVRSSAYYSIVAEEWPAVRDRLRGLLTAGYGSAKQ